MTTTGNGPSPSGSSRSPRTVSPPLVNSTSRCATRGLLSSMDVRLEWVASTHPDACGESTSNGSYQDKCFGDWLGRSGDPAKPGCQVLVHVNPGFAGGASGAAASR